MKNKEIIAEVRDILFHLILSCGKTEEEVYMINSCEADHKSLQYLNEVVNIFKDYEKVLGDFIKIVRCELGNN